MEFTNIHETLSERFISPQELSSLTGLSLPTLWRLRRRGDLPQPTQLSPRRIGWPVATIREWFAARVIEPRKTAR